MSRRVHATREIPGLERLTNAPQTTLTVGTPECSHAELVEAARGAEVIVCSITDPINAELLDALAPPLALVATFAVGYENIDIDAARARGVRVSHTPGVLTEATAEIALSLLLDCARRVTEGDRLLRAGRWKGFSPRFHLGRGVYGKTVGIVGAGRIARRVAETLVRGFDCELLVHSRTHRPLWEEDLGARFVSFDELLAESDFVSLHCPMTPETHHLIDADALARMKPSACLINTARGPVVDGEALADALDRGVIGTYLILKNLSKNRS